MAYYDFEANESNNSIIRRTINRRLNEINIVGN